MPSTDGNVREFYEHAGWHRSPSGKYLDTELFGVHHNSAAKVKAYRRRLERIRKCYRNTVPGLLEIGCGGLPATWLSPAGGVHLCVDFARRALEEARSVLGDRAHYVMADARALPFPDNTFGAVYAAHVLYHIENEYEQGLAFREIARVLRPGGDAVCIYANPFPILFPITAAKQLIKRIPWLWRLAIRMRPKRVLQYHPYSIAWLKRVCPPYVRIRVLSYAIPGSGLRPLLGSGPLSSVIVRLFSAVEDTIPSLAAYMSSYIIVHIRKQPVG